MAGSWPARVTITPFVCGMQPVARAWRRCRWERGRMCGCRRAACHIQRAKCACQPGTPQIECMHGCSRLGWRGCVKEVFDVSSSVHLCCMCFLAVRGIQTGSPPSRGALMAGSWPAGVTITPFACGMWPVARAWRRWRWVGGPLGAACRAMHSAFVRNVSCYCRTNTV
jgi:hypothetical protein